MPFQSMVPLQGMPQSPFDPKQGLTQADVEDLRAKLSRAGLQGSWLDQANDWRGDMVAKRDDVSSKILKGVFGKSGDAAGESTDGSALRSAAGSAIKSGAMSTL